MENRSNCFMLKKVKKNGKFDSFGKFGLSLTTIVNVFCICFLSGQIQKSFTIVVRLRPNVRKESKFSFFLMFFSIKVFFLISNRFSSSGWLWKAVTCSTKDGCYDIMGLWMYFSSGEKLKFPENLFWRILQLWNHF